jgi:hypothetical protein
MVCSAPLFHKDVTHLRTGVRIYKSTDLFAKLNCWAKHQHIRELAMIRFFVLGKIVAMSWVMIIPLKTFAWSIEKFQGVVSVEQKKHKTAPAAGLEMKAASSITTGSDGKVFVKEGESEVWIGPNTHFTIVKLADSDKGTMGRFDILKGQIRAKFKRPSGPEAFPYEIKARTIVAGVRGTEFFVAVSGDEEKVCTLEGLVRVTSVKSSAESWDVPAGKGLFAKPREMPKVRETTPEQAKAWIDATTF